MTRVFREVKLEYRLATPTGVTPTTQSKRWFFELPDARDTPSAWKDYSELIAFRLHAEGTIDDAQCIAFLQKLYPSKPTNGQLCFDNREKRLGNIVVIRSLPGHFRKPPGDEPFVSGPVRISDVGF